MKKLISMFNDPTTRRVILSTALSLTANTVLMYACLKNGQEYGGESVLRTAEQMQPGFIENFQKFVSAQKYGWKS